MPAKKNLLQKMRGIAQMLAKQRRHYLLCREHGLTRKKALTVTIKHTGVVTGDFDTGGSSIITVWRDARGLSDHEPKTGKWIKGKRGVLYDLGAHIGKFSFAAWKEGMSAYAFEPHFENFRTLCHNVLLNKSTVQPFQIAVLGKNEVTDFPLSQLSSGSANHGSPERRYASLPILSFSLYGLRDILKLPPPDYLKIDIDGREAEVLENAPLDSVKEILVEVSSDESRERVRRVLEKDFVKYDEDELVGVKETGARYPRNEFWKRKK